MCVNGLGKSNSSDFQTSESDPLEEKNLFDFGCLKIVRGPLDSDSILSLILAQFMPDKSMAVLLV